ncbi:SusC/RagA family TonB-linked outer membrane protein [Pedobacter cryophilus]|uniref:SusC/RagA family TonB-linked outer membrane protein n=1 Tax=Pedobacter cryophilus TaxID=2571271 RepID=A0A4U1BWK4_9SPHI|nr:SusC/RagA family TonB-linked outer membrane protein [Pedobacter cryophilus]TKB96691.1 SusC/RagA family TonB-linked outer membrane protein [Pedobacter cryophilus]
MKIFFTIIISFLLLNSAVAQQNIRIKGTITDQVTGEKIIGVSIKEKNIAGNGTVSDQDGKFTLLVSNTNAKLIVSYIGYATKEVSVTTNADLVISLNPGLLLNETVVTALGLERESKSLGYNVQQVSAKEITAVKSVNFLDNLTAKVAGVTITQGASGVGSTSKIVIRGESSFANNNPLFVVDGIPINNNSIIPRTVETPSSFQAIDFGNGAMDVNPDDIASVSILKGAAAAALYGSRAANGVIIINTKDGSDSKGFGVSFNTSTTIESAFKLPEFQNLYGQGNGGLFAFKDGLGGGINDVLTYSYGPRLDQGTLVAQYDSPVTLPDGRIVRGGDLALYNNLPITPTPFISHPDNLKNFFETGKTFTSNLAFSGKYDKGNYRLSYTDLRSESIIPGSNYLRKNVSANLNFKPVEKLSFKSTIIYQNAKSDNRPSSGYGSENLQYGLLAWLPRSLDLEPLKNYWQTGLEGLNNYSYNYAYFDNPYFILKENRNELNRDRVFGNIALKYDFLPNLFVQLRTGMDFSNDARRLLRHYSTNRFKTGAYGEQDVFFREINTDVLVNYSKKINDFGLDLSVGGNQMNQDFKSSQTQTSALAQPALFTLANAANPLEIFTNTTKKRINSVYGIAKFSYKNYLFVDVTGRNDWSSALATPQSTANTSFFYPSVSTSFVFSELVKIPKVSFAKLRVSYAQIGNDTDPYQTAGAFIPATPYNSAPTLSDQNIIANPNLLPEQTKSIELGADIRFFGDRLGIDATYYNALTENQILSLPVSLSTGYTQRVTNGGSVRSKGVELMVNVIPVLSKNFRWNTTLNFSKNVAKVESLPDGAKRLTLAYARVYDSPNQSVYYIAEEGGRIGDLWGTGYLKNSDGKFIVNSSGNLIADNTLKKLGNYNPDFMLGFNNTFSYKQFDFGFLFDWRQGGILVSRTLALAGVAGQLKETENRPTEGLVFDAVVNTGTTANPVYVQNTKAVSAESYYRQFYDRNHEENNTYDASYLKLRQFNVGYTFDKALLAKTFLKNVQQLKLSFIGRNIFAISEIPHFDPEQMALQGNKFLNGVEDMSYPSTRSFGLSLNVNF